MTSFPTPLSPRRKALRWVLAPSLMSLALSFASAETPASPGPVAKALQPFVDDHVLAGAVTLVADKEKILDVETVGFADVASHKAMTPDALFWIASMSKPITATAFMMLVDEGKIKLDDPVEKYLPEFKGQMVMTEKDNPQSLKAPKHPITVKNILSHTSGMAFASPMEKPTLDLFPLEDRVKSYAKMPLQFEPDTKYQYANAGINTAGRLIEVLSGMKYQDFLAKRLFEPLGMKDTTFFPTEAQITRIATSYGPTKDRSNIQATTVGQLKYPLTDAARQPMPAGGLFSTAADVAKFCQMLLNGGEIDGKRYISAESLKQMSSTQTGSLPNSYGLGFATDKKPGGAFGHGGAYSTDMTIDPPHNLITVFMVQNAGWRSDEGKKILPAFRKVARDTFAKEK